jgi:hypothetical protein
MHKYATATATAVAIPLITMLALAVSASLTPANAEAWRLVPAAGLGQLTGKPFRIGMGCHTQPQQLAASNMLVPNTRKSWRRITSSQV